MNHLREIDAARFEYSRGSRIYSYFGYVFTIVCGTLFIAGVFVVVVESASSPQVWFTAIGTSVLAAYMLMAARLGLKYRYIMYCVYTASADGISIERKTTSHFIPWDEIDAAEYLFDADRVSIVRQG